MSAAPQPALEAVLLVADQPLDNAVLAAALDHPADEVEQALLALARSYDDEGRGFELRRVGGGWRLFTRAEHDEVVTRFVLDGQQARLSQAGLETLAVVAYRQPISRSRVSAIRGVNVDGVMRTLLTRGLVEEAGADPTSGAVLYRTSDYFLERIGLGDLGELPPLAPFLPADDETADLVADFGASLAAVPASQPAPTGTAAEPEA